MLTLIEIKLFIMLAVLRQSVQRICGAYLRSLRPTNTAPFKEILQRWRSVGNTASNLTARNLNLRPRATETNALPLDQLTGLLL